MLNRRKKSAKSILVSKHSTIKCYFIHQVPLPSPKTKHSLASNGMFSLNFNNWNPHPKPELCGTDKALTIWYQVWSSFTKAKGFS